MRRSECSQTLNDMTTVSTRMIQDRSEDRTPIKKITTTEDNVQRVINRGLVINMVAYENMTNPAIKKRYPALGWPFIKVWAARTRAAMKAAGPGGSMAGRWASMPLRDSRYNHANFLFFFF